MTKKLIHKLAAVIFLGVALMIWVGCSGSDSPVTTENTLTDDSIPAILSGGLTGQVETIEGVQINLRFLQYGRIVSTTEVDANGNYQIEAIEPGTYTVEVTAKGFETAEMTVQVIANQVALLDKVALKALEIPVAHVRGLLSDQGTKKALSNVRVQLIDERGKTHEALTTETGIFTFENLPADLPVILKIDLEGYEKQEIVIDSIPEGETTKVSIELVPILPAEELPPGDGLSLGTKAPGFSLPDANGKNHSLADYAGQKKVVLVFYRGNW